MPGVTVSTAVRSGPTAYGEIEAAQAFFAGTAERGPDDEAKLVRSVSEYEFWYGTYESGNLHAHVKTFFEEGGQRAYIARATASAAVAGSITLVDRATTPENTLTLTAANDGDWDTKVAVQVTDGVATDTFKLLVYYDDVLVWTSRDLTDPADAVNVVNTSEVAHLLVATDESSTTTAPDNNPAVAVKTALSGGSDGTVADAEIYGALDLFTYSLGPGAVAIPGQTGDTFWAEIIDHAAANNRIALCAFGASDSISTVKTDVADYYNDADAEYAAFYYPHIKVPDPAYAGKEITISPEGYVAGARAKAIVANGPWMAGAGLISASSYLTDLASVSATQKYLTKDDSDGLDEKRINAIRKIGNSFRVYGARSVSSDEDNWRYITAQDTINMIVWGAENRLEDFVFSAIDSRGALFSRIEAALIGLLDPIRVDGGLYEAYDADGNMVDPGYTVIVSSDNNPLSQLASGKVVAEVGVRVSSIGDQIVVTITKSNLTSSV